MTCHAGLDASLEETAICVVDAEGRIVREVRAASGPDALVTVLEALACRSRGSAWSLFSDRVAA